MDTLHITLYGSCHSNSHLLGAASPNVFQAEALGLVTEVFCDSYKISKNLHIPLCTVRYFNAVYLQFHQKIVEVEIPEGSDVHTQSYCSL